MDAWSRFVNGVLGRFGVADPTFAATYGIGANRFYRRTAEEGWDKPVPRVRVHPDAGRSVQRALLVVCSSSADVAAASREAAAWLHGLADRPPRQPTVVGQHATRCRAHGGVRIHRARWLRPDDVVEVDGVPALALPATLLTSAGATERAQRARLIDAVHRGLTTTDEVLARLEAAGPVPGKGLLRALCLDIGHQRLQSIFNHDVREELASLGYGPGPVSLRIPTPDGIGLETDIPLTTWQVDVEPDGDGNHRTREQRRIDRRRDAAFAGTDWVRVPVDWRDWHLDREHVLAAIDAAIEAQRRRGIGRAFPPPRRVIGR